MSWVWQPIKDGPYSIHRIMKCDINANLGQLELDLGLCLAIYTQAKLQPRLVWDLAWVRLIFAILYESNLNLMINEKL